MNQPKPKQIRLPFSVPKPGRSKAQQRICGICRRTEGKYTCPRCNLVYCSLACFQAQAHAQCSEPFYKSTVMNQIAADPQVGLDDKKGMIEMLRRFEQQAENGEALDLENDDEAEEEDEDELTAKLKDVNIDEIDTNKLFHLLPQQHRDAFLAAIRDPESQAGRELLATAGEEDGSDANEEIVPTDLPWWEKPDVLEEVDEDTDLSYASEPSALDPKPLEGIAPPDGSGLKLVYNALAIGVAYIHILLAFRLPSLDVFYLTDADVQPKEVKRQLDKFLPFLMNAKSTVRYETARDAYSSVWERNDSPDSVAPDQSVLLRLLDTTRRLAHPPITMDPPRIHLVLADLYQLCSTPKVSHVSKKLLFYVAALLQLERQDWLRLEREVISEIDKLETELQTEPDSQPAGQRTNLLL